MDFPSREEARVYISLQGSGGASAAPSGAIAAEPAPRNDPPPAAPPASVSPDSAVGDSTATSTKVYRVEKKGFENDTYDRRAMRNLIRSGGLAESDSVRVDDGEPRRAADYPELKSLFELRKTSRVQPPTVCRKHTDQLAHYQCTETGRPLCEACAAEKKFGGASVRVCEHCGGTVNELATLEP